MAALTFLEKDLEDLIIHSDPPALEERGLSINSDIKFLRQVRIGEYGIIDLLGYLPFFEKSETCATDLTIFELKQNEINIQSLLQLSRYRKGIELIFPKCDITGVLIGRKIDLNSDFIYLASQVDSLEIYTYSYGIEGLLFDQIYPSSYAIANPGNISDAKKFMLEQFNKNTYRPEPALMLDLNQKQIDNLPF